MEVFCFPFRLAVSRMAKGEPTPEEMAKFVSIAAVVDWAGVPETLAQEFFGAVGATGEEHPRTLGEVSSEEMNEGIKDLKINDKPLSLMQNGQIRTVHRVCCLMAGTSTTAEEIETLKDQLDKVVKTVGTLTQAEPTEVPPSKPPLCSPQVHLKQVISQASEEAVPLISQSDLLKHWDCFKKIYGRDPKPDEECTGTSLPVSMLCCSEIWSRTSTSAYGDQTIITF